MMKVTGGRWSGRTRNNAAGSWWEWCRNAITTLRGHCAEVAASRTGEQRSTVRLSAQQITRNNESGESRARGVPQRPVACCVVQSFHTFFLLGYGLFQM